MRKTLTLIAILAASTAAGIGVVHLLDRSPDMEPAPKRETPKSIEPVIPKAPAAEKVKKTETIPEGGVRVIFISVDGFRTDLTRHMPGFRAMQSHGAWTLRATTTVPSITTVAHASMFTGQPPGAHGVSGQAPKGRALKSWSPLRVKSIFEDLDLTRHRPKAFLQKEKLARLLPPSAFTRVMLDRATRESRIVKEVCSEVGNPEGSRMMVVHLKRFDAVGHDEGWMSPDQVAAAKPVDDALMAISTCIAGAQASGEGSFALIVTADHGGHDFDHDSRDERDMHVPFLVIGPGVKAGHHIRGEIHIMDSAAVIRHFLGFGERMHDGIRGRFPGEILGH